MDSAATLKHYYGTDRRLETIIALLEDIRRELKNLSEGLKE